MPNFNKIDTKPKKKNTDYTLLIMIVFILVAIISFVVYGIMNAKSNSKTNTTKTEKSKYVYTVSKVVSLRERRIWQENDVHAICSNISAHFYRNTC